MVSVFGARPVPHICEALGLDLNREEAALEARAELWWGHRQLRVWTPPGSMKVESCLRSDLLSEWLDDVAGRCQDPGKLMAFRDSIADMARVLFEPSYDMSKMPAGAFLMNIVTFDEPPPPDLVAKLGRLIDHLSAEARPGGIVSPEKIAELRTLVAKAEQLRDQEDTSASSEIAAEADRILSAAPGRAR